MVGMSPSRAPSHSAGLTTNFGRWFLMGSVGLVVVVTGVALGATAGSSADNRGTPTATGPASSSTASATNAAQGSDFVPPPAPASEINATPDTGDVSFTFAAAGDVLSHGPVLTSATTSEGYNFAPLLDPVRDYVSGPDLAICHLEVPVAPEGTKPSGYPMFAAPAQMVKGLHDEGWDGCSTASNHSVDRRYTGIETTLDTLDALGMGHAGTARTEEEANSVQMYRVRTGGRLISVANISFAYGLNGLPKPDGMPWAVNTFDADAADAQPIIDRAQQARDAGADVVIASVHCCVEYQTAPTPAQRKIAEDIAASGLVDLYVGHHAHVPQPVERLPGGPDGTGMWTAFGLGNFLSNQDTQCCVAETNSGILLTATFTVSAAGEVDVDAEWTAVTVDRKSRHTVHALRDIPDGTATLSASEVAARLKRVTDAAGPDAPERTEPATAAADDSYRVPRVANP